MSEQGANLFKSPEELKRDAYAYAGWTEARGTEANEFLSKLKPYAREFFDRMREIQRGPGRPSEGRKFEAMVPEPMFTAIGEATGRPIGEGIRPSFTVVVNSTGQAVAAMNGEPMNGTEFVLGAAGMRLPNWDLFDGFKDDIFEAIVAGMATELDREARRVFLGI